MSQFGKRIGLLVGAIIVLALLGQAGVAGLLATFGLLVAVLFMAVGGARPGSNKEGGRQRKARTLRFLARYRPVDELEGLHGLLIAGLAAWSTLELIDGLSAAGVMTVGLLIPALIYVVWPNGSAAMLGVLGSIAATAGVFTGLGCSGPVSAQGRTLFTLVLAGTVGIFLVVRSGLFPVPRPMSRSCTLGASALIVFGLLEMASFVVNPNGLDVFLDAPGWTAAVALALVIVIACFAAYAPGFVLALLALAVAVAQVSLAAIEVGALGPAATVCGAPWLSLIYAVAFSVAAIIGIGLKPGRRR